MRRSPFVLVGTALGLVGVFSFRSSPATISAAVTTTTNATATIPGGTTGATTTTVVTSGPHTATGPQENFNFGILAVKVSAVGKRITSVTVPFLNDGGNPRSQYIDQYAIPILEQEVIAAQSGNIQSVSGASWTSAGFIQSLQAALTTMGI